MYLYVCVFFNQVQPETDSGRHEAGGGGIFTCNCWMGQRLSSHLCTGQAETADFQTVSIILSYFINEIKAI